MKLILLILTFLTYSNSHAAKFQFSSPFLPTGKAMTYFKDWEQRTPINQYNEEEMPHAPMALVDSCQSMHEIFADRMLKVKPDTRVTFQSSVYRATSNMDINPDPNGLYYYSTFFYCVLDVNDPASELERFNFPKEKAKDLSDHLNHVYENLKIILALDAHPGRVVAIARSWITALRLKTKN